MALSQRFTSVQRPRFDGGINYTYGSRQVSDNESPNAVNCDFKGKTGVGNRSGYTQLGTVSTYNIGKGLTQFHTSTIDQLVKFVSNDTNTILSYSTGGAWTDETGTTFADLNMDACQGASKLYTGNGSDVMKEWNGTTWGITSNGTKGYYPTYFNSRIWVKDETDADRLNFSGQYGGTDNAEVDPGKSTPVTADKLGDFVDATAGWIRFKAGSGAIITGLVTFKNALYVFLSDSIYRVSPASAADTFTVELITNSVGCISHRTIKQVEEDIYFASPDGVYSLGDVANYTAVRTTNKSAKIQRIFDSLTATQKQSLCAAYYQFKYYLFFTVSNSVNDSCMVYDIRYKAWQEWRNMGAVAAMRVFLEEEERMFFIEPAAKVHEIGGSTDDGTPISSYWYSKSYTENFPEVLKFYFDTTFVLGALDGTATFTIIFDDTTSTASVTLSQAKPQGGCGSNACGDSRGAGAWSGSPAGKLITTQGGVGWGYNASPIVQVVNMPHKMKARGKKFSIQYKIASSDDWRLDSISQYVSLFDHFVFTTGNKLN